MLRSAVLVAALSLSMAGVAHAGLFSDDEAHKKIDDLQKQTVAQMQAMETRMAKMESQLSGQGLVDLLNQLEVLKTELNKLRGQLEVQTHELETTQKRQKDLYADLDARLRNLERPGSANAAVPAPAAPIPTAKQAATPPATSADKAVETGAKVAAPQSAPGTEVVESKAYDAALSLFKVGNFQGAIAGFQNFLKSYPTSGLAPSAQYWIGNAHFAQRDYKSALEAQRKLLAIYPNSQKVPDAMLNMASCQTELNDTASARKTLEELVAKYPLSSAAELAQKRLGNAKK
jgi:tol-pal system protein YbgF